MMPDANVAATCCLLAAANRAEMSVDSAAILISVSMLGGTLTKSTKRLILSALEYRPRTVGTVGLGSTVERCMPNGRHTVDQPDEGNHDGGGHGRETQATVSPPEWTERPEQQEH